MYRKGIDHLIWSNYHNDFESWKKGFLENCAADEDKTYSEDALRQAFYDYEAAYLDDQRNNLNIQLSTPILIFGDGCKDCKEIASGNIRDCLYGSQGVNCNTWYVDTDGEFRCDIIHQEGFGSYCYRAYRNDVSDKDMKKLWEMIERRTANKKNIEDLTYRLGDEIGKVYGWQFPNKTIK